MNKKNSCGYKANQTRYGRPPVTDLDEKHNSTCYQKNSEYKTQYHPGSRAFVLQKAFHGIPQDQKIEYAGKNTGEKRYDDM